MGPIGMPELIIILVIALIIFGPRKLPELGKSLGKSLNEFKRASADLQNTLEQEIKLEEQKEQTTKAQTRRAEADVDSAVQTFSGQDTTSGQDTSGQTVARAPGSTEPEPVGQSTERHS